MIVADTDVLVDYLRGGDAARRVEVELSTGHLATTVVAAFELIQGVQDVSAEAKVDALLAAMDILPLTLKSARSAGRIRRTLRNARQEIGVADSLIAGICLTHKAVLLTRNQKHFERVPGLLLAPHL